ncbi:MAG: hypothetical protein JXR53_12960 [Bacteroidales bacterium]|nr:hypothetical protein [Bacteroidales bacterium]
MKKVLVFIAMVMFFLSGFAQKDAVIHYISLVVDDELTDEVTIETKDRNFLNGYSEKEIFPDSLMDTLMLYTEEYLSAQLDMNVSCYFRQNKKGEKITTIGTGNELVGMPAGTISQAIEETEADYFIKIVGHIMGGGTSIQIGENKWSKVKPKITLEVIVKDRDKKKFWDRKITVKEFGKLRSRTHSEEDGSGTTYEVTKRETLMPADIVWIYLTALEKMMDMDE